MDSVFLFLEAHLIEILGTVTGIFYIVFSVKQNIWLWPVGLFTSCFQLIDFYNQKIYADMSLQGYYIVISIYGWYNWVYGKKKNEKVLPVNKMNKKDWGIYILISSIMFFIIRYFLQHYTDSDVFTVDAFTTAFAITATFLLAKKYIDNWYIWFVVDIISMVLYIYKEYYFYAGLYLIFATLCIAGVKSWQKDIIPEKR